MLNFLNGVCYYIGSCKNEVDLIQKKLDFKVEKSSKKVARF